MKKSLIVFPFLLLLVFMIISFGSYKPGDNNTDSITVSDTAKKGFAVIELFTSEGCSSCPAADKAVAVLEKDFAQGLYILAFHVDYWDYLGWKDPFSDAAYSKRQQQYGESFNLNSIYTPQVIVNGKIQFTGSDESSLRKAVMQALDAAAPGMVNLTAVVDPAKKVAVTYTSSLAANNGLCIALVQRRASSQVQRGENRGKQLSHIDVVRGFKTMSAAAGNVLFELPAGLSAADCKVLAFIQDNKNNYITGAAECVIQ